MSSTVRGAEWINAVSKKWFERSDASHLDPRGAFDEAVEVHYPSARGDSTAYYHPDGDVVFIESDGFVRTCIALRDRSRREQEYVRNQVSSQ